VAARVGSQFSDIREVVQVRLERGEVVELKGTKQVGTGDSAGTGYKIAPPAGEFRWVHGKYVDADYPRDGVRKAAVEENSLVRRHPTTAQAAGAAAPDAERSERDASERPSAGSRRTSAGVQSLPRVERDAVAAPLQPPGHHPQDGRGVLQLPAGSVRQVSTEGFQAELDDINTELSIMLAEEPTVWNCDELKHRCEALLAQAETALERGRARVLVNRIAQADDIKRRFEDVGTLKPDTDLRKWGRVAGSGRPGSGGGGRADDRYDGTGRLARVTPSKVGAPRYALLDENGDVLCYVSPAPGVNMQYYLGREVGVSGQQGYIADGGAQHIMAKHVTALDNPLR
jgi:hypothetical protein